MIYQTTYQLGVFLSRSSVNIFPIRQLYLLPVLQVCIFALMLAQALIEFLPNVYCVITIILVEGLLGGLTYANAFWQISHQVDPRYREYSMGVASVADTCGIVMAAVGSIGLTPLIVNLRK
eukprot:TRINITY_DN2247_c0_g1_i1.p1 TRINITY_DN2247_c0_g1~~TRINITY_DN2247_c0_g1_i1.p1  ORF type:complete len:121 (+),score=11.49 TRINITY_DN2247_c0_g1_i1:384-746(+)